MAAALNWLVANFEQRITDVPRRGELEETRKVFEDLSAALQTSRAQGVAMENHLLQYLSQIMALEDEKLEQVCRLHASKRLCEARSAEMEMLSNQVEELKA